MNPTAAVAAAAQSEGISSSTLWNWLRLVDGVPVKDRLPRLAPRRQGGGVEVTVDPEIWQVLLSDYLRLSKPSWSTCYRSEEHTSELQSLMRISYAVFRLKKKKEDRH